MHSRTLKNFHYLDFIMLECKATWPNFCFINFLLFPHGKWLWYLIESKWLWMHFLSCIQWYIFNFVYRTIFSLSLLTIPYMLISSLPWKPSFPFPFHHWILYFMHFNSLIETNIDQFFFLFRSSRFVLFWTIEFINIHSFWKFRLTNYQFQYQNNTPNCEFVGFFWVNNKLCVREGFQIMPRKLPNILFR
jgi:hypothetical protein